MMWVSSHLNILDTYILYLVRTPNRPLSMRQPSWNTSPSSPVTDEGVWVGFPRCFASKLFHAFRRTWYDSSAQFVSPRLTVIVTSGICEEQTICRRAACSSLAPTCLYDCGWLFLGLLPRSKIRDQSDSLIVLHDGSNSAWTPKRPIIQNQSSNSLKRLQLLYVPTVSCKNWYSKLWGPPSLYWRQLFKNVDLSVQAPASDFMHPSFHE